MSIEIYMHALILGLIIVAAFLALTLEDLLSAVVSIAAMGLLLSLEFYILQAPDVAMAEAAIGAALTAAIFIMAINRTKRWE